MNSLIPRISVHDAQSYALSISGKLVSYEKLLGLSGAIAKCLSKGIGGPLSVVAVLGEKSEFTYAGILGIHCAGKGYLPLLPSFPVSRLLSMLEQSQTDVLVVAKGLTRITSSLLELCSREFLVVCEDESDLTILENKFRKHRFVKSGEPELIAPTELESNAIAYLLFTSGSTGNPKGVPVRYSNLAAYLRNVENIVKGIGPGDRCSQTFNLTFDLSVHDIFFTLCSGACLYPLSQLDLLAPAKFIRENEISCWFSVPAVGMLMERTRTLRPNVFPGLKYGIFCGEALPINTAKNWKSAAPSAQLFNFYGPTEATIAISAYRWNCNTPGESKNGVVPIGTMFPGQQYKLIDDSIGIADSAKRGELVVCGDQVTNGYLNLPEESSKKFISSDQDLTGIWYRTGDLVEEDEDGCLHFIRRIDDQVQLRGHRVEIQEVEHHIRLASESDLTIALAINDGSTTREIIAVVSGSPLSPKEILAKCADRMPPYMMPSRIEVISKFPLNSNGKIDRQTVLRKVLGHEVL